MKRFVGACIGCIILVIISGCSENLNNSLDVSDNSSVIHSQDSSFQVELIEKTDGSLDYWVDVESRIEQAKTCRIKYHNLYNSARYMVVEGSIGSNTKPYPVILDTGASQPVFVNHNHVKQNHLQVYPIENENFDSFDFALCHLPELNLDNIKLVNFPAYCLKSKGLDFLGLLFNNNDAVILGLPALMEFNYITFDSLNEQVEFSAAQSFKPENKNDWEKFPISVEQDFHANAFLFVQIVLNGEEVELQLDTGSGNGLAVSNEIFEKIASTKTKMKNARQYYPFIGNLKCKKTTLPSLNINEFTVSDVMVSVFPDDSELLEDCDGLIGMQLFRNTVIVLDFENEFLWIKKSTTN